METIKHFHGYEFLSHPKAGIALLDGNPCHEEALSVAKLVDVDFSLQLVVNHAKRIVKAFGGSLRRMPVVPLRKRNGLNPNR